ncbi:MAG: DUF1304 family protein [Pseudomonadota bacterium]
MDTALILLQDHFACVWVDRDPLCILVAIIALMHVGFAFMQTAFWRRTARSLTYLDEHAISDARGLGASIASYNLAIAIGLALSFGLEDGARHWVHIAAMALIAFTALIGWATTKGNRIFYVRLLPAAVTLAALFLLPILAPGLTGALGPAPGAPLAGGIAADQAPAETTGN